MENLFLIVVAAVVSTLIWAMFIIVDSQYLNLIRLVGILASISWLLTSLSFLSFGNFRDVALFLAGMVALLSLVLLRE